VANARAVTFDADCTASRLGQTHARMKGIVATVCAKAGRRGRERRAYGDDRDLPPQVVPRGGTDRPATSRLRDEPAISSPEDAER
jgi:hypothetical protein